MRKSLTNPLLAFIVLIIVIITFSFIGNSIESYFPPQKPQEIAAMEIGDTVIAGMKVVDDAKVRKVPLIYHPTYLVDYFKDVRIYQVLNGITTGTIETPIDKITSGSISRYGIAQGFEGPGFITVNSGHLAVQPPGTYLWGFKHPTIIGMKTKNGLEIKQQNKTLKIISSSDINNDNVPHNYVKVKNIKKWYAKSDVGARINLDYGLAYFNDGRNSVSSEQIKNYFGANVLKYMKLYPNGSPVMVYTTSKHQKVIGSAVSVLGSYPQYNDANRAFNAKQFAMGWNGTFIPPHTSSHGKETVGFSGVSDPHSPLGDATHGVCPPGRALRDAGYNAGFPLPPGMANGELSVLFTTNPTTTIAVTNTRNNPVKLKMWTVGSGPSMRIYCKIVELLP
ncbi:MAG: hypothetical protein ACXVHW_07470 [Methanobacterium sp.]